MAKKKRVKKPSDLSLAQLQQLVDSKASELSELRAERAALQKQLDELDRQIEETEGVGAQETSVVKKKASEGIATKKTRAKKKVALQKGKKAGRQKKGSAKDFAEAVLKKEPEGLPLDELSQRILESGYETTSTNFKNTLYQALYNARKAGETFDFNDKTSKWVLR